MLFCCEALKSRILTGFYRHNDNNGQDVIENVFVCPKSSTELK